MILPGPKMMPMVGDRIEDTQSLPAMTSNTAPAGHIASASSQNGSNLAWRAFDQIVPPDLVTAWVTTSGGHLNSWVQRQVPSAIKVARYRIMAGPAATAGALRAPRNFKLQGSNNGSSYTDLDERTNETSWSDDEVREYDIAEPALYTHYRLFILTTNGGGNFASVGQLEMLQAL